MLYSVFLTELSLSTPQFGFSSLSFKFKVQQHFEFLSTIVSKCVISAGYGIMFTVKVYGSTAKEDNVILNCYYTEIHTNVLLFISSSVPAGCILFV